MALYPYTCEFCGTQKLSSELPKGWLLINVEREDGYVCESCRAKREDHIDLAGFVFRALAGPRGGK